MNRFLLATGLLLATPAVAAAPTNGASTDAKAVRPGTYAVEPTHTRIQFTVSHMGFTEWYGDFTGASGSLVLDSAKPSASRVDITIPSASVSTTNAKLDGELKSPDWFDATQFPTIHFVSTSVTPTGSSTASIAGTLTFHGVTKPVTLKARFHGAGVNPLDKAYTVGFDATTAIRRSDFGVKTYVPLIGDDVAIRISAAFEAK